MKIENQYTTIRVDREKIQPLKFLSYKYGTNLSMVINIALKEFIEKKDNKEFLERFKI